jgi:hypothetical protein
MAATMRQPMVRYFLPATRLMRDIERYRRRPMPMLCLIYVGGDPVLGESLEQAELRAEEARLGACVRALTGKRRIAAARALDLAVRERTVLSNWQARDLELLVAGAMGRRDS